ncbi:MAG: ATP-binding protein, partial [Oscillospiraceae bacterium]|nr:ATP-binding protein [Oscillospiraceae bacterium]
SIIYHTSCQGKRARPCDSISWLLRQFSPAPRQNSPAICCHLISAVTINATATIERLQQRKLDQISAQLITPLQQFLPSVRDINIHIQKERRRAALRSSAEVVINDGTPTPIQQKGDGIKSLTALAMLNITNQADRISVIAIEEPESHLHPESAHQLYETILALSEHHQVILTTHSPLFVNRSNIKANIIVTDGKATSGKK